MTAMGAKHWGVRWPPMGRAYGYNSYVLERDGTRMLLACDSAFTPLFETLASNPPDIAAFSIAAYDPWIRNHANPGAGVGDVPAKRRALPGADSLGDFPALQGADGRTDAPADGGGRAPRRSRRDTPDRGRLEPAGDGATVHGSR